MKNKYSYNYIYQKLIMSIVIAISISCSDDNNPTTSDNASIPIVTTSEISLISSFTARGGGTITSDGGANIIARGVCWDTTHLPTINNNLTNDSSGTGGFISRIFGLEAERTYYVRAFATNRVGTGYGDTLSFKTLESITDINGNIYPTIKIGDQLWMMENLKVTHYRNGDAISNVTDSIAWYNLTSGAWCSYNNSSGLIEDYGLLYNWYAVNDIRNLAPEGWHIPSLNECLTLFNHLGGDNIAGGKLKQVGTSHWFSPNSGASNESGFSALPGGLRSFSGKVFSSLGMLSVFWTSSPYSIGSAISYGLHYQNTTAGYGNSSKQGGFSVRCLKN